MSQKLTLNSTVELFGRVKMPLLGLGVYQAGPGKETYAAVKWALEKGYRHIDTAHIYGNEEAVGQAVKNSGIPREEIFVTTKLWNSDHGYVKAKKALRRCLEELALDYVDLYLIHWPVEKLRLESWKALVELKNEGLCRSIGVSNFTTRHLLELFQFSDNETSSERPSVNQVEFSPFLYQKELLEFCLKNGIFLEAYSPLTKGKKLDHPKLLRVAEKYGKTSAQILIRWCLEHNVIVIPKSSSEERIEENADVFDFSLSEEDMTILNSLNENFRTSWDPTDIV